MITATEIAYQVKDLTGTGNLRVLVVEDDITFRPFWVSVIGRCANQVRIDWAKSVVEAEAKIREAFRGGNPYDLVVADIFLEGGRTGLELWNDFREEAGNFMFVSGHSLNEEDIRMSLDFGCPVYMQKPLSAEKCVRAVRTMFNE